jgi:hypothetical protein
LNNRIMAGWPLFVYPKYFCSQNKPAERRSHPILLSQTWTATYKRMLENFSPVEPLYAHPAQ